MLRKQCHHKAKVIAAMKVLETSNSTTPSSPGADDAVRQNIATHEHNIPANNTGWMVTRGVGEVGVIIRKRAYFGFGKIVAFTQVLLHHEN